MRTVRIATLQKRAKRRMFAFAIAAGLCVGYGALSLFAEEQIGNGKPSFSQSNSRSPGSRTPGIRLSKNKPTTAAKTIEMHGMQTLPPHSTLAASSNAADSANPSLLSGPSSPSGLSLPMPSPPVATELQTPTLLPSPSPSLASESRETAPLQVLPPADQSPLTPPPRMTEAAMQAPPGRVVVKLNNQENAASSESNSIDLAARATADSEISSNESVEIRVMPPLEKGKTTALPSLTLFEGQSGPSMVPNSSLATPETIDLPQSDATKKPMKVTLNEVKPVNEPLALTSDSNTKKNRAPALVRTKPTTITHTVQLAESAELEPFDPKVEDHLPLNSMENANIAKIEARGTQTTVDIAESTGKSGAKSSKSLAEPVVADVVEAFRPRQIEAHAASHQKPSRVPSEKTQVNTRKFTTKNLPRVDGSTTTMEIESQTVSSLELHSPVTSIAIENEDVCQVVHGDRSISIVGNNVGTTLVQVWTEESNEIPYVIRINVSQQWHRPTNKANDINEVKNAIERAFPRSNINILVSEAGVVEVRGTTDSEDSARRILEIVRKLCLVPVKDKVTVGR